MTAVAVAAVCVAPALAQNTTAAMTGRVTADGRPLVGATVVIVHRESGSTHSTSTDADGRYAARGLRVGGPYTITVSQGGRTERREDIFLALAETAAVDVAIGATAAATVVVTGSAISDRFGSTNTGAGTSLSSRELNTYSSVARSLQDYARIDPRLSQTDKDRQEISALGQNSRYNSVTIDGVTINDTFGLEANNLPTLKQPISIDAIQSVQVNISNFDVTQKAYTGANINAVTKSGTNEFKGGVYYVFRDDGLAGKRFNRTNGSYFSPPPFDESTKGFVLGGPIVKDKLFFFAGYEELESSRDAPTFGPLGSSLTNVGITASAISAAQNIARSVYNIDIGTSDVPSGTRLRVEDTLFKLDWNISDDHRANLRYTKTEQSDPNIANRNFGNRSLSLNSHWDTQVKNLETTVAQWFGDWTPTFSTELKLSQRKYESVFNTNSDMPVVTLSFTGALPAGSPSGVATGTRSLVFGTERFRHFNALKTDTLDAYFGGTWTLGAHELKFGADWSSNEIFNAFLQDTKGVYTFACVNSSATYTYSFGAITCATATAAQIEQAVLENYRIGRPTNYQVQVPTAGRTLDDAAANWTLDNLGLFLQDAWKLGKTLTLTAGLRVDRQTTGDRPARNDAVAQPVVAGNPATGARQTGGFGLDNTQTIDGDELVQPRLSFGWAIPAERRMQLRGGLGLFQGAAANVWLTNPFSNPGVSTRIIGCGITGFPACGATPIYNPDPTRQPTNFAGVSSVANVDLIAPGTSQPAVWKLNLAFDAELPWFGWVGGLEWIHTRTEAGLHYEHLNLGAPTRSGTDGRLLYYTAQAYNPACWTSGGATITTGACAGLRARALSNASFGDVVLARKTTKGEGDTYTVYLNKPAAAGLGWGVSYTRGRANEVNPLTSSRAISNWTARSAFNPNEEVTANSSYLVKDRLAANLSWSKAIVGKHRTTVGLFYEGRRGKPYSWTYINDINGDGQSGNDLMYIPSAPGSGEVVFLGDTAPNGPTEQAFWAVVEQHKELRIRKGGTTRRNGSFAPIANSFDVRVSQELPGFLPAHKASVTLDILNFGNLLNKRWGRIDEVAFVTAAGGVSRSFVNYVGLNPQGKYIYAMGSVEDFITKQSRGESQWAAQVTLRYEF
jgi:outer membrane receptor protein involved in Fe transport